MFTMKKFFVIAIIFFSALSAFPQTKPVDTDGNGLREIKSFSNLAWVSEHSESWSWDFEMIDDIEISESITQIGNIFQSDSIPDMPFSGTFDGNGFKIFLSIGMRDGVIPKGSMGGFFGLIDSTGIVKNLILEVPMIFVGKNLGKIENCTSKLIYFVETNYGTICQCKSNWNMLLGGDNSLNIGGFARDNYGKIEYCKSNGEIKLRELVCQEVGGFVCHNYGEITNSISNISIDCDANRYDSGVHCYIDDNYHSFVGGFAAYNFGLISQSNAISKVQNSYHDLYIYVHDILCKYECTNNFTAGFIAWNEGEVYNSFAGSNNYEFDIESNNYQAGFIGFNNGLLHNCYVAEGTFIGYNAYTEYGIMNCFYENSDKVNNAISNDDGIQQIHSRTQKLMKSQSTFTDYSWDFKSIWDIDSSRNEGYPYIRDDAPIQTAPDLIYPRNGEQNFSSTSHFVWTRIIGADKYKISIAKDSLFKELVINEYSNNSRFQLTGKLMYGTRYYWKVVSYVNNEILDTSKVSWFDCRDGIEPLDTDGDGSRNITKLENFLWISKNKSSWGDEFELDNNINFANAITWNNGTGISPIGTFVGDMSDLNIPFTGKFDGQGYTIDSITVFNDAETVGLFGYINNSEISNLTFTNARFGGRNNIVGSLAGVNGGTIKNCSVNGVIRGYNVVGGMIGVNQKEVIESSVDMRVRQFVERGSVGGLVGINDSTAILSNCNAKSIIKSVAPCAGITGYNYGIMERCVANMNILPQKLSGGVVAINYGDVELCNSVGSINISIDNKVFTGGIVGVNYGDISKSFTDIYIKAITYEHSCIGGIAGLNEVTGNLGNCYVRGKVIGKAVEDYWEVFDGALVGANLGNCYNSYSLITGKILDKVKVWYPVGFKKAQKLKNCFGLIDDSTKTDSVFKISSELKQTSMFTNAGWDFDTVWNIDSEINEGYPFLRMDSLGGDEDENEDENEDEDEDEMNIILYPNPVKSILYLKTESYAKIRIYDISGVLIGYYEGNRIDVSNLHKGVYLSVIEIDNDLYRYKFIKE